VERVPNRRNLFLMSLGEKSSGLIFLVREIYLGQDFAAKIASTRRVSSEFARISCGEFLIKTRQKDRRTGLPEWRGDRTYQRTATMIRMRAAIPTMMISRSLLLILPAAKSRSSLSARVANRANSSSLSVEIAASTFSGLI
jgi:hypothetical protein